MKEITGFVDFAIAGNTSMAQWRRKLTPLAR